MPRPPAKGLLLKKFGTRLRALRKRAGFTQQELAQKAGLDWKYVGAIERAERNPSLDVVARLAFGLGVELPQLFYFGERSEVADDRVAERQLTYAIQSAAPDELLLIRDVISAVLRRAGR